MTDDLKKSQLRAFQYWYVDGVGEFSVGFFFLLVAVISYLQAAAPGSLLSKIFSVVSVLVICGGSFGIRWIIQRIKEHTTYPHTGYLTYKSGWGNKSTVAITIAVLALFFAFIVFITITDSKLADWAPGVGGLFGGFFFAWVGYRCALPRYYLLALFFLLIGGGLAVSGLGNVLALPLFFGLTGLALLASGGLTLWSYLRRNPPLQEASDEH